MSDFRKNPRKPFEVSCPNKIRKRITMHEKTDTPPKICFQKIPQIQGRPGPSMGLGGMLAVLSTLLCRTKKLFR